MRPFMHNNITSDADSILYAIRNTYKNYPWHYRATLMKADKIYLKSVRDEFIKERYGTCQYCSKKRMSTGYVQRAVCFAMPERVIRREEDPACDYFELDQNIKITYKNIADTLRKEAIDKYFKRRVM